MKYKNGDIICLNDGKNVYVFDVNNSTKEYQVVSMEDGDDIFFITEEKVFMKLT